MIDVKQAAEKAREYFVELNKDRQLYFLSLEEVELSEDEKYWFITLSYSDDPISSSSRYKIFKIDANSGRVISMKIRTL